MIIERDRVIERDRERDSRSTCRATKLTYLQHKRYLVYTILQ